MKHIQLLWETLELSTTNMHEWVQSHIEEWRDTLYAFKHEKMKNFIYGF